MSFDNLKKFLTLPKMQFGGGFDPNNPMSRYDYTSPFQFPQSQQNPNSGMSVYSGYNPDLQYQQANPYYGMSVNSGYAPAQAPAPDINWLSDLTKTMSQNIQSAQNPVTPIAQNTSTVQTPPLTAYDDGSAPQLGAISSNYKSPQTNISNLNTQGGYQFNTSGNNVTAGQALDAQTNYNKQQAEQPLKLFNPFGGVDVSAALQYGFYNAGQGNGGQATLGFGKGLLGLARQGFSAYGAGKEQRNLMNQQNNQPIYNSTPLEKGGFVDYMQKGGSVSVGKFLSGKYITDSSDQNVEIEKNEFVLNAKDGQVQKAIGETHEKGGIKTNLPEGSQVLSDHTKIGAKNAKELSKELDIKVKAKNTFADVLDKYSKKIGVEKNIEEGEKLVNQTEETLKLEETDTKQINLDFIQQETARIEQEKEELNTQQQEAFKTIFDKQESQKGNFLQEGGETVATATQEEEINPNDIVVQVQQAVAQGAPIEEIVNNLLSMGYSEDEASQIIQASQSEQQPQMQEGGVAGEPGARIGDFLKSANLIAQSKGVEPPKLDLEKGDITKNWTELQNWFVKNAPEEVISYFDEQPITNKGMEILLKNNKTALKNLGIDTNRKPNSFSLEEKRAIQEAIPLDDKFILDQFADGKVDYRFPQVSANSLSSITPQNQAINASMVSPSGNGFQEQEMTAQATDNNTQQNSAQRGRNVIPMLPVLEGLTPSAALIPRADQVRFNRLEPTLRTPEASIAAINNQTNFVNQQAFQSNPNLAPFLTATNLGTTQQSVNKAIAETDAYNAEAVNRANTYNANVGDKEQLMNINLGQNYEQRLFKTIDNQEQAWSRYLVNKQLQNKQNWMDVNNLNLTNAMTPNYQTDGSNVYFSNPRDYSTRSEQDIQFDNWYRNATPQEQIAYRNSVISKKQDGGYIYEFEDGAQPMTDQQAREVAQATGFTEDFAREYFRQQGANQTPQYQQAPQRPRVNLETDMIADITSGTNRYTPNGGVIVGDYKKVWLNNRPETFTARTQPQEGRDFTYLSPQDFVKFQQSQNYKQYKSGYKTSNIASR